jgi:hypothetical protein
MEELLAVLERDPSGRTRRLIVTVVVVTALLIAVVAEVLQMWMFTHWIRGAPR